MVYKCLLSDNHHILETSSHLPGNDAIIIAVEYSIQPALMVVSRQLNAEYSYIAYREMVLTTSFDLDFEFDNINDDWRYSAADSLSNLKHHEHFRCLFMRVARVSIELSVDSEISMSDVHLHFSKFKCWPM